MTIARTSLITVFGLFALLGCLAGCDKPLGGTWPAQGGTGVTSQAGAPSGEARGGAGGAGGAGGSAAGDLLVDDFEDGNSLSLIGGSWYSYDDTVNGGVSHITALGTGNNDMKGVGYQSQRSLLVEFGFDKGTLPYEPYVGFGLNVSRDLSPYAGISYVYQGGKHEVRVETTDVKDYDFHAYQLPASSTWRTVELPFADFVQGGFGAKVALNLAHPSALSWHIRGATGQNDKLMIDDVKLIGTVSTTKTPDLVVNPAAPPTDEAIASIAITNPLQAKAAAYLEHGYNITNWLESGRFSGFVLYDESFVAKLAQAGFTSLRLPIDLDLYVDQMTVNGTDVSLVVNPDLFTILDSFDQWTAKYGISLTIDYHQYDASLNFADATSTAETVALWSQVAEHFASNAREDIFFELLNEPRLSSGGTPPTQAEWTALAERMIAAIRARDTRHTIIFGDVDWYDIAKLTQRTPFSDANVVYAFHFYEPFLFTHQGANWTGLGTAHDIPYPYSTDRWSQYSADFGFAQVTEQWLWDSLRNYYVNGTKSALRNRVVAAKRWAVANNVPVICNEFGAYDQSSQLADRARYYTDIVDIFAELAIPWQHWFMIMDPATGAVIPEYTTAMRLVPKP
jgi:endoglucanase